MPSLPSPSNRIFDKIATCLNTCFLLARQRASKKSKGHIKRDFFYRQRRSSEPEVTIQLLVVVDREMIAFHSNESIEEYVLTVMNMVSILLLERNTAPTSFPGISPIRPTERERERRVSVSLSLSLTYVQKCMQWRQW